MFEESIDSIKTPDSDAGFEIEEQIMETSVKVAPLETSHLETEKVAGLQLYVYFFHLLLCFIRSYIVAAYIGL